MAKKNIPTTLVGKRLLEIDGIIGSDIVYTKMQSVDSNLKVMRITDSNNEYINSIISHLEDNR